MALNLICWVITLQTMGLAKATAKVHTLRYQSLNMTYFFHQDPYMILYEINENVKYKKQIQIVWIIFFWFSSDPQHILPLSFMVILNLAYRQVKA